MNSRIRTALSIALAIHLVATVHDRSHAAVNVAFFGTATQSTTGFGGDPARAIDGNTSGVYGDNTVTHTDTGDPAPWWEVALGGELPIERIALWNRTDCCPGRLTNIVVTVLDDDRAETFSEALFPDGAGFPDPSHEIEVGAEGSIVRVEILDTHPGFDPAEYFLSLAEVEVFADVDDVAPVITRQPRGGRGAAGGSFTFTVEAIGSEPLSYQWEKDEVAIDGATESSLVLTDLTFDDAGEYSVVVSNALDSRTSELAALEITPPNVAVCGVASQSTAGFGGVAERAIDGNTDGVYDNGSVTHTNGDPMAWWEVTLAQDTTIETVVLWNRTDCCQARLSSFTVLISDAARNEVWSEEFFSDGSFPDTTDAGFEIEVGGVEGRTVRIQKSLEAAETWLSLAEVEIFSDGPCTIPEIPECPLEGDVDFADTHCGGIAIEGPDDGGSGAYVVTADGTDDSGDVIQYTFTAVHRAFGTAITRGPQFDRSATLPLSFGAWDITVTVDDRLDCEDVAEDATCADVVEVIDPDCIEGELCNVAPRGRATQSSTGFGLPAGLAIDGNTDGNASAVSLTHTNFDDPSPNWEVELDQIYAIETIVLWNRTDCCRERLTNFRVTIYDDARQEVYSDEFFTDGADSPNPSFEILIEGEEGRFVEVKLLDTHPGFTPDNFFLSLAEVQVFAFPGAPAGASLQPADVNGDGAYNISDPVAHLNALFSGESFPACYVVPDSSPIELTEAGRSILDFNGDGGSNIADAVGSLNFLFGGGSEHALGQDCVELPGTCESSCQ